MTSSDLFIDIETRSGVDLARGGVYRYTEDKDFAILVLAYHWGDWDPGRVEVIDVFKDGIPEELLSLIFYNKVIKHAFNASFERICLSRYIYEYVPGKFLDPESWRCDMVAAAGAGINGSLKQVAEAFLVSERKSASGAALIKKFSIPPFQHPEDNFLEWETFLEYCAQDVRTEVAIHKAVSPWYLSDAVWREYALSERINDRGILIDPELCKAAVAMAGAGKTDAAMELRRITGLNNPNSVAQLRAWIETQGVHCESLSKEKAQDIIDDEATPDKVREALEIRLGSAQASVAKYQTALDMVCADGRIRGQFAFYGALTGRWAGRGVQLHNLSRNYIEPLESIREIAKLEDAEALEAVSPVNVGDSLKQLVRTMLISAPGNTFYVADFSAIEARLTAWLARETWVMDVFRGDGKIYEATAARMLHKDISAVTKADRQKGKIATLALGYSGGYGALVAMGALKMGIPENELQDIVTTWRRANPNIVKLWGSAETIAKNAVDGTSQILNGILFKKTGNALTITLPSGRKLVYQKPQIDAGRITYLGSYKSGIARIHTRGGTLVEWVDFTQGLDARLLQMPNVIAHMNKIKIKMLHFAWDFMNESEAVLNGLSLYRNYGAVQDERKRCVYVLTNFDTLPDEDLYRIYKLREMKYDPYVMIYDKPSAPRQTRLLQRWVNNKRIWRSCERFEDYDAKKG